MSIRHGLLALLSQESMGVYQLRKEFEARTGGTWPLNIGQVYSTIQRLERDGLVAPVPVIGDEVERYDLTDAGHQAASSWWTDPVLRGAPERDELVIKLALAITVPGLDVRAVVQAQRRETMRALRDFTRLKGTTPDDEAHPGGDLAWSLVLEHHIFAAEAEMRWLDHIEASVRRAVAGAQAETTASAAHVGAAVDGAAVEERGGRQEPGRDRVPTGPDQTVSSAPSPAGPAVSGTAERQGRRR